MKKIVLASLLLACLPYLSFAQSSDDDLYFIPKKKTEKKTTVSTQSTTVNSSEQNKPSNTGSAFVVRDASGKIRDVDEYNRRYTSRDNNFSLENDTLYIQEKPFNERGEWVNGFNGSEQDYEYAMRIIRFRNPYYAIPISSPLYWDVLYTLPSWDWNVFDDGFYAYAFPTFSNSLWSSWRWNYPYGSRWGLGYNWYSPWYGSYYSSWGWGSRWSLGWGSYYGPYYTPYYGSYWGSYYGPGWRHNYYRNDYWGRPNIGSSIRNGNGVYNNRRAEVVPNRSSSRYDGTNRRSYSSGRVVDGSNSSSSIRPQRTVQPNRATSTGVNNSSRSDRNYPSSTYTRPSVNRGESSYSRPSSTRSSVRENNALNRMNNSDRNYNSSRSSSNSSRDSYNSNSSSYRSSGSSSRSSSGGSYQSSGSSSRSTGGGGARRR